MSHRTDSASRLVRASPARIFEAYVNPESLAQWLPPPGMTCTIDTFDPRAGGTYQMTLRYDRPSETPRGKTTPQSDIVKGQFVRLIPSHEIVQRVEFDSDDPAFAGTMTLTWSLKPVPDGTLVIVKCENVPPGISREDHELGLKATLSNLAAFIE